MHHKWTTKLSSDRHITDIKTCHQDVCTRVHTRVKSVRAHMICAEANVWAIKGLVWASYMFSHGSLRAWPQNLYEDAAKPMASLRSNHCKWSSRRSQGQRPALWATTLRNLCLTDHISNAPWWIKAGSHASKTNIMKPNITQTNRGRHSYELLRCSECQQGGLSDNKCQALS